MSMHHADRENLSNLLIAVFSDDIAGAQHFANQLKHSRDQFISDAVVYAKRGKTIAKQMFSDARHVGPNPSRPMPRRVAEPAVRAKRKRGGGG